jgi:hypothetical protein
VRPEAIFGLGQLAAQRLCHLPAVEEEIAGRAQVALICNQSMKAAGRCRRPAPYKSSRLTDLLVVGLLARVLLLERELAPGFLDFDEIDRIIAERQKQFIGADRSTIIRELLAKAQK